MSVFLYLRCTGAGEESETPTLATFNIASLSVRTFSHDHCANQNLQLTASSFAAIGICFAFSENNGKEFKRLSSSRERKRFVKYLYKTLDPRRDPKRGRFLEHDKETDLYREITPKETRRKIFSELNKKVAGVRFAQQSLCTITLKHTPVLLLFFAPYRSLDGLETET
jgi:hypothetical protein